MPAGLGRDMLRCVSCENAPNVRRIVKAVLPEGAGYEARRALQSSFVSRTRLAALLVIPGRALRANPESSSFGHPWIPGSLAQERKRPGMTRRGCNPLRCVRGTDACLPHTRSRAMLAPRQPFNKGAREARHGQGSDADRKGKEETEAGQEPEKGRRRAVAVRLRQVAAEPLSRQEGLTADFSPSRHCPPGALSP